MSPAEHHYGNHKPRDMKGCDDMYPKYTFPLLYLGRIGGILLDPDMSAHSKLPLQYACKGTCTTGQVSTKH